VKLREERFYDWRDVRELVLTVRALIAEAEESDCELGRNGMEEGCRSGGGHHGEGCPVARLKSKLGPFEAVR
jgi:hypothetical protein